MKTKNVKFTFDDRSLASVEEMQSNPIPLHFTIEDFAVANNLLIQQNTRLEAQLAALSWARWISVRDRLPDERGYYLASGAYLTGDKWIDKLYFDDDQEWYSHQSLRRSTTHWMPLPPAPEQEPVAPQAEP